MEKTDSNKQSQGKTERAIEVILQADQPAVQLALGVLNIWFLYIVQ